MDMEILDLGTKVQDKIVKIQFGVMSPEEIKKLAVCEINNTYLGSVGKDIKESSKIYGSVYDPRLGTIENGKACETCGHDAHVCPGHFGYIQLPMPIINPVYFSVILSILKTVCDTCSSILISKEALELQGILKYRGFSRFEKIIENCSTINACSSCGASCAKYSLKDNTIKKFINNSKKKEKYDVEPQEIFNILMKISNDDFNTLGFNSCLNNNKIYTNKKNYMNVRVTHSHQIRPEFFFFTVLPVLPTCARPYSLREGTRNDDVLSEYYISIVKNSNKLQNNTSEKKKVTTITEKKKCVNVLNDCIKALISSKDNAQNLKNLKQRISGKDGCIRKYVQGKRSNYTARTVIDGEVRFGINYVGVPDVIAKILTKPVIVTNFNYDKMQHLVDRGKVGWIIRGINKFQIKNNVGNCIIKRIFSLQPKDFIGLLNENNIYKKIEITIDNLDDYQYLIDLKRIDCKVLRLSGLSYKVVFIVKKSDIIEHRIVIKIGDEVHREIETNDRVIMNRQPTLRLESMLSFYVKRMPPSFGKSLRLDLLNCTPFNADFDGDEMNLHVPQNIFADTELHTIMAMENHILSPQHNAPCMGLIQDALLGVFILTYQNKMISKFEFLEALSILDYIPDFEEFFIRVRKHYPSFTRNFHGENKTYLIPGKLLISILFPSNFNYDKVTETDVDNPIFEVKDGIITKNSGPMCKKVIGANKSNSIHHILYLEYGSDITVKFLSHIQFVVNRWLPFRGFSVGIWDCILRDQHKIQEIMEKTTIKYNNRLLCNDIHREHELNMILNSALNEAMKITSTGLNGGNKNGFSIMCSSGAKGSATNALQISAFVGQQNVKGQRVPHMISNRTRCLPYFDSSDQSHISRGFVKSSYFNGLNPQEMFFHAMAGREGLTDTAAKTSETGYIQRKLVKKMENLKTNYDKTVRSNDGKIIQFIYGGNGYDPSKLYYVKKQLFFVDPFSLARRLSHNSTVGPNGNNIQKLTKEQIKTIYKKINISKYNIEIAKKATKKVRLQLKKYLKDVKIDHDKIQEFSDIIEQKFNRSLLDGGEMVGIIASVSLGEPTTQGTLNTFHSTGISSKDVTLGVPRMEECLNATKNPKNPSCFFFLNNKYLKKLENKIEKYNIRDSQKYKNKINNYRFKYLVYLNEQRKHFQYGEVKTFIHPKPKFLKVEKDNPGEPTIMIQKFESYKVEWWEKLYRRLYHSKLPNIKANYWVLELDLIFEKLYEYNITASEICRKLEMNDLIHCTCIPSPENIGKIRIYFDFENISEKIETNNDVITNDNLHYYILRDIIIERVMSTYICGIEEIKFLYFKEIINGPKRRWGIDTVGSNLLEIMNRDDVEIETIYCDNFWEVYNVFGIESARNVLIKEFTKSLCSDGCYLYPSHIQLLVDSMTHTGIITCVNRSGIDRGVGPISKSAFECVLDNFSHAGKFGEEENATSVSASITLGQTIKGGTGFCHILPRKDMIGHVSIPPIKIVEQIDQILEPNNNNNNGNNKGIKEFKPPTNTIKIFERRRPINDKLSKHF